MRAGDRGRRCRARPSASARRARRRGGMVVVAALVAGCALSGCGGPQSPLAQATGAATRSLARSALMALTVNATALLGPSANSIVAQGAFSLRTGLGYEEIGLPVDATGPARPAYLIFEPARIFLEPVVSGGTAFAKGKRWIVATAGPDPRFPRFVLQAQALDPELLLDEVAWGGESASAGRSVVIDHLPLTSFVVTVELKRALMRAKQTAERSVTAAIALQLAALTRSTGRSPASAAITVWIDSSGLVAEIEATVAGSGLGAVVIALPTYRTRLGPLSLPPQSEVVAPGGLPKPAGGARAPWVLPAGR